MGKSVPKTGWMKLLWENQNPEASFSAQKIELDLSPYKTVLIRYRDNTNQQSPEMLESSIHFVDNTRSLIVQTIERSGNVFRRALRANTSGIMFSECFGPQDTVINTIAVPCQVYGIQF